MAQVKRKSFTDAEIRTALYSNKGNLKETALELTALGRGKVSAQLLRYWVRTLGVPAAPEVLEQVEGPAILFVDIETSPILAAVWSIWQNGVGLPMVHHEWYIMAAAWKWMYTDKVEYRDVQLTGEDDSHLLKELWNLLDKADIVVAHNGRKFDVKKINARFLLADMPPPSPYKIVDTLEYAKRHFAFTSNKLMWLSENLTDTPKDDHAEFPGYELWKECLAGNPKAWACMRKYNIRDIESLEKVYLRLRAWAEGHVNVAAYFEDAEVRCPKCGSKNIEKVGYALTQTGKYHRYQCNTCHGFSRSRYTLNSTEKRKSLLSN